MMLAALACMQLPHFVFRAAKHITFLPSLSTTSFTSFSKKVSSAALIHVHQYPYLAQEAKRIQIPPVDSVQTASGIYTLVSLQ